MYIQHVAQPKIVSAGFQTTELSYTHGRVTYIMYVLRFFLKCTVPGTQLSILASLSAWPPLIWTLLLSGVTSKPVTLGKTAALFISQR